MDASGFSFESEWPETAERLKVALLRRRIPHCVVDDLIQETALRLYQRWDCVDPERGTWPLAFTVAMNILKDQLRSDIRRQALTPPSTPPEQDPEVVALARLELARVRDALPLLSPAQRSALLAEVGEGEGGSRSTSAVKMLRMRARKRLKAITQEVPGVLAPIELFAQRTADRLQGLQFSVALSACTPMAAGLLTFGMVAIESPVSAADATLPKHGTLESIEALNVAARFLELTDKAISTGATRDITLVMRLADASVPPAVAGSSRADPQTNDARSMPSSRNVQAHEQIQPLPPAGEAPTPVTVERSEASADPDRGANIDLQASGSVQGHEGSVNFSLSSHAQEAKNKWVVSPQVKGGAQLEGKDLLELGQ